MPRHPMIELLDLQILKTWHLSRFSPSVLFTRFLFCADSDAVRLISEVEESISLLPVMVGSTNIQAEIALALQPLRSENVQLRRSARVYRILNLNNCCIEYNTITDMHVSVLQGSVRICIKAINWLKTNWMNNMICQCWEKLPNQVKSITLALSRSFGCL